MIASLVSITVGLELVGGPIDPNPKAYRYDAIELVTLSSRQPKARAI